MLGLNCHDVVTYALTNKILWLEKSDRKQLDFF